jgi:hypothetical protein
MQDEGFAAEFDRPRNVIVEAAFCMISQNIEKAVSTLVGLLDTGDDRVKRLTAKLRGHITRAKGEDPGRSDRDFRTCIYTLQ